MTARQREHLQTLLLRGATASGFESDLWTCPRLAHVIGRRFGSIARGEADERSDVDLLVDMEPGRSLLDHAALSIELTRLLDCKVDGVSARALKPRIRERVLKEAVAL